jgi:hypothetical protein
MRVNVYSTARLGAVAFQVGTGQAWNWTSGAWAAYDPKASVLVFTPVASQVPPPLDLLLSADLGSVPTDGTAVVYAVTLDSQGQPASVTDWTKMSFAAPTAQMWNWPG